MYARVHLAIASGLMLGREGPHSGPKWLGGKGIANWLKSSPVEERSLIASEPLQYLAAALMHRLWYLLFVVEEVLSFSTIFPSQL